MLTTIRLAILAGSLIAGTVFAQIASAQTTSAQLNGSLQFRNAPAVGTNYSQNGTINTVGDQFTRMESRLNSRLRAVQDDQKAFISYVVTQVKTNKIDAKLVAAIERYALRRNKQLPFNYFERAIRFEAGRRGISVPSVRTFATSKFVRQAIAR